MKEKFSWFGDKNGAVYKANLGFWFDFEALRKKEEILKVVDVKKANRTNFKKFSIEQFKEMLNSKYLTKEMRHVICEMIKKRG